MNEIKVGNQYKTRGGFDVKVLAIYKELPAKCVVAVVKTPDYDTVETFYINGSFLHPNRGKHDYDLIEYSLWDNVAVDTPIIVSCSGFTNLRRHFAKYENGTVFFFTSGATSWSADKDTALTEAETATLYNPNS